MARLPKICWSLAPVSVGEALRLACQTKPAAQRFVELRLDYLADPVQAPDAVRLLRRARIPAIATLRCVPAGGMYAGTLEQQLRILEECGRAGAEILDLEIESAERAGRAAVARLRGPARLLVSFHDYRQTPEEPLAALRRLRAFPADFYKVAAVSNRQRDNAALLGLNRAVPGKVVAFAMGELGLPTRVLALTCGAPFTYAALSAGQAVAPGQLPGAELLARYRVSRLSARTAVYGVIGNPLAHSISPQVHNAAFVSTRRDAIYLPFRVELLEDFLEALPAFRLSGFSVTIPHKEAIARAADWVEPEAREVGAVNTIVRRGKKLYGYNTDMAGVIVPLEKRLRLRGARVLVAGAGGAARAAAFALARRKARVVVVSRRQEQAVALAEQIGGETVERNSLSGEKFDAIVHATPLGMYPDTESCFFSPGELNAPLLLETVYSPVETRLVQMARRRGVQVIPGLEMFLEQAAGQFELWTRAKAPRAVMARAARQALAEAAASPAAGAEEARRRADS